MEKTLIKTKIKILISGKKKSSIHVEISHQSQGGKLFKAIYIFKEIYNVGVSTTRRGL